MYHQVHTYTELQQQIHDDLRIQHPEWVNSNAECPTCDSYESRLMELLDARSPVESPAHPLRFDAPDGGSTVAFGEYGLKALERGWITNRQIEAARIAMTRKIKRGGKVWINIFPDKPVTAKPAETRMGSGKGSPEGWVAVVKPGRVMFELAGVPEPLAREAMRLAGHKLPVKTKFVVREGQEQ